MRPAARAFQVPAVGTTNIGGGRGLLWGVIASVTANAAGDLHVECFDGSAGGSKALVGYVSATTDGGGLLHAGSAVLTVPNGPTKFENGLTVRLTASGAVALDACQVYANFEDLISPHEALFHDSTLDVTIRDLIQLASEIGGQ